ncbi:MAG: adenylate/guanylate cyclase domain-containing protein [Candidatus Pacebacteria bacterium]|nr:adenylate/guanylate cyclase domain-containing protein [Candidatus Paceibacterota bacterium]
MALADTLTTEIESILTTAWNVRNGNIVPDSSNLALNGEAVKITATFLYADLAGSSVLAQKCPWQTTAKIVRAYLNLCTRLIRSHGGEIRSFDGDRVMGIFKSNTPNTDAVSCAREIDWAVTNILNPKATARFDSIKNNNIRIKHCVGVDSGEVVAVRAGLRNNNDLIWIGQAPSLAAKLSDIRNYPYEVYITKVAYDAISGGKQLSEGVCIWEPVIVKYAEENRTVYRTKTPLKP